ncbi:hypothetical protein ABK040_008233 [Willaertia magna]
MDTSIKCVVVGDGAVGKTCMLISFASNTFPEDYVPTVFDNYSANVLYKDTTVALGLWDTAGQDDYDRLRPLSYPDAQVFLVCFSVVNPTSLHNIKAKWVPEIRHHCPKVPLVVAGTKTDLRKDPDYLERENIKAVTKDEGIQIAKDVGACFYTECSAKTGEGLKDTFNFVIQCALDPNSTQNGKEEKKKGCNIQ